MVQDIEALIPPAIMAVIFVCIVVTMLRSQNPRRREQTLLREREAERTDPRFRQG